MLFTVIQGFVLFIFILFFIIKLKLNYWKRKGVVHLKPAFLFGNYKDYILLKKQIGLVARDICKQFPDEPFIGSYFGTEPALIIQDPELIKLIMVKDSNYFNGREITKYNDSEPINKALFFAGGSLWKTLRYNLTPLFSSSKMKNMFHLIQNCSETLEEILKKETAESRSIEAKNIAIRYVMDCIGFCFLGINTDVMKTNVYSNPFAIVGQQIFCSTESGRRKVVFRAMWPAIFYGLRFQCFTPDICNFFFQKCKEIIESRKYQKTLKKDFIDHILTWKSKKTLLGSNLNNKMESTVPFSLEVNDDLIVAQCVQLFSAGFETSAGVISFGLFELAKCKEAQKTVIEEIDSYFAKNLGKIDYNCMYDLPFLEACIDETMRLYPAVSVIARETTKNYTLPSGLKLDKGLRIHIPVNHLHQHPKYFSEPKKFRPERFFGEEKKKVLPFTYLPFGDGSRICIGARFAKMTMIPAFLTIFKDYEIELMEGMPSTLKILPGALVTQAVDDIRLKFIKRNN